MNTHALAAPDSSASWRVTVPVPLPSVFSTALATPGSPALHRCDPGRGPWMSRTWYGVFGIPTARKTSAVTAPPEALIVAFASPKPLASTYLATEKSHDR